MRTISSLILVFSLFAIISCKNLTIKEPEIMINLDENVQEVIEYTSFVDSISYIPLETTEACLIGEVSDIQLTDSFIFVLDKRQPVIFIFDRDGNFINKIDRKGQGPGEYGWILQFHYNQTRKSISICTASGSCKIIEYDLEGNFINEFNNNFYSGDLYQFKNGDYLLSRIGRTDDPQASVLICDSKGNIKNELLQRNSKYAIDCSDNWELEVFDNTINFVSSQLDNTIYNYANDTLTKTISFNILPTPTKDFHKTRPDVLALGPYFYRTIYKESKNWIYLVYSSNEKGLRILLYNKNTGTFQIGEKTMNNIDNKEFIYQTSASENNTFTYCIPGENDDNPIIQILHLK